MPALAALALCLSLSAAPLPFPAPRLITVTDRTKFDPGVVVSFDAAKNELRVRCADGLVTFKTGPDVQVFDAAGKPHGAPSALAAGQKVRIWYVIDGGAKVQEIALEP
jgi:hypothetical protein